MKLKLCFFIFVSLAIFLVACNQTEDIMQNESICMDGQKQEIPKETLQKEFPEMFQEDTDLYNSTYETEFPHYIIGFNDLYLYYELENEVTQQIEIMRVNKQGITEKLYTLAPSQVGLGSVLCNNILFIPEIFYQEGKNFFRLKLSYLNLDSGTTPTCFYDKDIYGWPNIDNLDDKLLVETLTRDEKDIVTVDLFYISTLDYSIHNIDQVTYFTDLNNGLNTGTMIGCAGGMDDYIYYQKVYFQMESINGDETGIAALYRYNTKTGQTIKIRDLERKIIFVTGGKDFFILSYFADDKNKPSSGRIYIRDGLNYHEYEIPGVKAGYDLLGAAKLENNKVFLYSVESIYVYDMLNYTYKRVSTGDLSNGTWAYHYKNNIGYLVRNSESILIFHYFSID